MLSFHQRSPAILLRLGLGFLALTAVACSKGSSTDDAFAPRRFEAIRDGEWIGHAICYGPHRDDQRPGDASPSDRQLREDVQILSSHWSLLRVYSSSEFSEALLRILREEGSGMKVVLGAWIAPEAVEANRLEVETAIRLANEYPEQVVAVCVGNETQVVWSGHRSPMDLLIEHIRTVREAVTVPVTTADDFNFWNKAESRALDAEVDFIMVHAHPMWNGRQLEEALPWLQKQVAAVQAMHPELQVVLGETGWATSVYDQGEQGELILGQAGEAQQKTFYEEVWNWAESTHLVTFFFEAFDENWKGGDHPDEVEKHWGLFRADRSPKSAMEPDSPH